MTILYLTSLHVTTAVGQSFKLLDKRPLKGQKVTKIFTNFPWYRNRPSQSPKSLIWCDKRCKNSQPHCHMYSLIFI